MCVRAHCFRLPGAEEGYHGGRSNRDSKKEALATLKSRFPGVHNIDLLLYMKLSWGRDAKNKGFPINVHVPTMLHACCRLSFTHTQGSTQRWTLWLSCSLPLSISSLIERGKHHHEPAVLGHDLIKFVFFPSITCAETVSDSLIRHHVLMTMSV